MPTEKPATDCLSEEAIRSFAAYPFRDGNPDVAAHVYVCERCQRRLENLLYPPEKSSLSPEDRLAIDSFVGRRCGGADTLRRRLDEFIESRQACFFSPAAPEWRLAAASPAAGNEEAKRPEDVRFMFASEDGCDGADVWRAELKIPGDVAGGHPLEISVSDGDGRRVGNGLFTVAGTTLAVESGAASIPYDMFLVGIRNSRITFQREGGNPVPGRLLFF